GGDADGELVGRPGGQLRTDDPDRRGIGGEVGGPAHRVAGDVPRLAVGLVGRVVAERGRVRGCVVDGRAVHRLHAGEHVVTAEGGAPSVAHVGQDVDDVGEVLGDRVRRADGDGPGPLPHAVAGGVGDVGLVGRLDDLGVPGVVDGDARGVGGAQALDARGHAVDEPLPAREAGVVLHLV